MAEFLIIVTFIILFMSGFVLLTIMHSRKKQMVFLTTLKQVQDEFDRNIIESQLEIQEQTFQHISREIHDNINLSLTLAKLQLNMFDWNDREKSAIKLETSINLLSTSIADLSDLSRSKNADLITEQGVIKALEEEVERIKHPGIFELDYEVKGNPVYMESNRELIIFRIIQEAFNNIIKHAKADKIRLQLDYQDDKLLISIYDNGQGFDPMQDGKRKRAGITNMKNRTKLLNGQMHISSIAGTGTELQFIIPINQS